MHATTDVMEVWKQFDDFAMETLTKAWHWKQHQGSVSQRTVAQMKEHRHLYGTSGNCFDLAIWLIDECRLKGITAYATGHDWHTPNAHVAVIVVNHEGYRFLCDLGDQWIQPILVDPRSEDFCEDMMAGFFPAARTQVKVQHQQAEIAYIRPNGKVSRQVFGLEPVEDGQVWEAGGRSQRDVRQSLVERRLFLGNDDVHHWEFSRWHSFVSTPQGLQPEAPLESLFAWSERIQSRTGMAQSVIESALTYYMEIEKVKPDR
ncbi:hypothetical protein [Marinicrinis sediminis]|uniref:Arylamine N-acetyltransferase n=1 Tax=Marinicrinis sediminis TaxID=1652465 RepID=A0ABW5RC39_9BACL